MLVLKLSFLPRELFVRLSVCHTRALWQYQTMYFGYFDTTRKGNHSSFLTPTVVGGRRPLPSEICAQSDQPSSKNADVDRFSLITSQPWRDSEKVQLWRTGSRQGFPASYRWSAYITPKSPKDGSKAICV